MENLRENNYGYELPPAILGLIEDFEEGEEEENLEILNQILDLCDHTDLNMLSQFDIIDNLMSTYDELRSDENALLEMLVTQAQKEN